MPDLIKLLIALAIPVLVFWIYLRVKRKAQDQLAKKQKESLDDWVKDRN